MRRKKLLVGVLAIALLIGTASAALLTYYGRITGTVTVDQAVKLDGLDVPGGSMAITETLSGCDKILGDMHNLTTCSEIKKPLVMLNVSSVTCPHGCVGGEVDVYPEYRLDARYYDDALFVVLNETILWSQFANHSFGYFMEPGYPLKWIPQCNLALRDSEGAVKYFASWHSFRTGINGTIGVQKSITYEKDDFYFYRRNWALLGLWSDARWIKDSYTSLTELLTVAETNALKAEINNLMFKYFTRQGGDTSTDPNTGPWEQIVWLYKFAVPGREIKGIAIPKGYDPAIDVVEFRMVYDFACTAYPGVYTIVTDVVPLCWMDP